MTEKEIEKVIKIKEEIEDLRKCVEFFVPENGEYVSRNDKEKAIERIKSGAKLLFHGFGKKVQLNAPGFFGGKAIEVDMDFVNYCREYFENKLEEKKKRA